MAANRKNQSAAHRFGPAVKVILLCLLAGGSALGFVWQKDQINRLGNEWKAREELRARLINQNELKRRQLAQMRSPEFLEWKIRELNLGLVPPQPSQVLRLHEPVPGVAPPNVPMQYAARAEREPNLE
jgi:hypothetical protein